MAVKVTAAALVIAAISVVVQILSGAEYPKVPPVFFILLIPAALLLFTRWRFAWFLALLSGVFLLSGLVVSGAYNRLLHPVTQGDTVGLWMMAVSLVVATSGAVVTARQNYHRKKGG